MLGDASYFPIFWFHHLHLSAAFADHIYKMDVTSS